MVNIKNILVGFGNSFLDKFDLLSEEKKRKSEDRLLKCRDCPMWNKGTCSSKVRAEVMNDILYDNGVLIKKGSLVKGCGCFLFEKSLSDENCPRGLWGKNVVFEKKEENGSN